MSNNYKNILTGYVNENPNGDGHYLTIKNTTGKRWEYYDKRAKKVTVTMEPGAVLFLRRTPPQVLQEHPKVPHYSLSEKIEDEPTQNTNKDYVDPSDLPF